MTRKLSLISLFAAVILFAHMVDRCSAGLAAVHTGEVVLR